MNKIIGPSPATPFGPFPMLTTGSFPTTGLAPAPPVGLGPYPDITPAYLAAMVIGDDTRVFESGDENHGIVFNPCGMHDNPGQLHMIIHKYDLVSVLSPTANSFKPREYQILQLYGLTIRHELISIRVDKYAIGFVRCPVLAQFDIYDEVVIFDIVGSHTVFRYYHGTVDIEAIFHCHLAAFAAGVPMNSFAYETESILQVEQDLTDEPMPSTAALSYRPIIQVFEYNSNACPFPNTTL
ncbi:hypothetical protein JKY72_04030 [Candidatus Gracilibacteria bacterium]|nr:hypothetical protein [Candidatus Gracilibacteria bacterium]